jgi:hypothetical protein
MRYVSGTKLDERIIRCDLDLGYKEGRQFGRGKSGGQVRDEHRQDYDPGRGGWGAQAQRLEIERRREVEERYADAQDGPGAVAGGGGDWKEAEGAAPDGKLKRGRSPDDEGDNARMVWSNSFPGGLIYLTMKTGPADETRRRHRSRTDVVAICYSWTIFLFPVFPHHLGLNLSTSKFKIESESIHNASI